MIDTKTAPYAALLLRVSLGGLLLAHAGLKYFVFTPAGTEKFFASLGLPGWFGLVVMAGETVCGLALILGVYSHCGLAHGGGPAGRGVYGAYS